ncbi:MAG: cupin domain-containing protein [Betaproteobacteria bacterium]|nr:cupin domain-containing protein [Betaproteobacteria bacterium]
MAASAHAHPLLRAKEIEALPEEARVHPLDPASVRHTRSLGDAVGLNTIGVHQVRLKHGRTSSVHHFHHHDEEWVYILSGRGVAEIGDEKFEVGAGDFMGFVAGSLPHSLINPNVEDLVYLVGGNRLPFDVCDYPRVRMRRYRLNGVNEYVSLDALEKRQSKIGNEGPLKKQPT